MIPKSAIIPAEYYMGYIDMIKEDDFREAIRKNTRQFRKLTESIPRKKFDYAYAEGKWTIREMMQHIIDAERVFSYRALTFSRKDASPLPGFDESTWAAQAGGSSRRWKDLLEEFASVRESTQHLYDSLSDDQLTFTGQANGCPLNGYTLGFIIPGHVAHHMRILQERYL